MRHLISELEGDVRLALRHLRASPGFAAVAIATLALGSGVTTAMFSVVDAVLLRPVPVPEPERVVNISEVNPRGTPWTTSEPNYLDYRDLSQSFASMGAVRGRTASLSGRGDPVLLNGSDATASYFSIFGTTALLGSAYGPENDKPGSDTHVVVLSEGLWRRVFGGDRGIVGTSILIDGVAHRVTGVMPQGYGYLPGDFWTPMAPDPGANRGSHQLVAFARLRDGVSQAQAQGELEVVARDLSARFPKSNGHWGVRLSTFEDFIVGPDLKRQVIVLFAAVGFVLLLACVNVANLLLVRATAREREVVVRVALGAGRARLVRQFLTESVVIAGCGAALGLALAGALMPLIRTAGPLGIARVDEVALHWPVFAFAAATAVITGIAFGLMPALHTVPSDLQRVLRHGARVAGAGRAVRNSLIVVEVAFATILLVGAGLLGVSFVKLQAVAPGFRSDGVVQMSVTAPASMARERRAEFFQHIEDALAAVGGVKAVGASTVAPFTGYNTATQYLQEGHETNPDEFLVADWRSTTPRFFDALDIALVRGRRLEPTDTADRPYVAVIDETLARRMFGNADPLGKRVVAAQSARGPNDYAEVVGVVRDVRDQTPAADPAPAIYFTEMQKPWSQMTFFVRIEAPVAAIASNLRRAFREAAPEIPVPDLVPVENNLTTFLAPQRFAAWLVMAFSVLALLLASIGLYGVVSYGVALRTGEMGLRMALGASPGEVATSVVRDSLQLALAGAALGAVLAVSAGRAASGLLFGVAPWNTGILGVVVLTLLLVTTGAALFPARRAARVDPAVALRND